MNYIVSEEELAEFGFRCSCFKEAMNGDYSRKGKLEFDDEFYSGEGGDFYLGDWCIGSFSKRKNKILKQAIGKSVKLVIIIPDTH